MKDVNGNQFATFTIADTVKSKNSEGVNVERTTWFECAMKPSNVLPYLKKGQLVMVIGRVYANAYISKQTGEPAATLKVQVHEINLLGSGKNDTQQPQHAQQSQQTAQPAQQPVQQSIAMPQEGEDDLPF